MENRLRADFGDVPRKNDSKLVVQVGCGYLRAFNTSSSPAFYQVGTSAQWAHIRDPYRRTQMDLLGWSYNAMLLKL